MYGQINLHLPGARNGSHMNQLPIVGGTVLSGAAAVVVGADVVTMSTAATAIRGAVAATAIRGAVAVGAAVVTISTELKNEC